MYKKVCGFVLSLVLMTGATVYLAANYSLTADGTGLLIVGNLAGAVVLGIAFFGSNLQWWARLVPIGIVTLALAVAFTLVPLIAVDRQAEVLAASSHFTDEVIVSGCMVSKPGKASNGLKVAEKEDGCLVTLDITHNYLLVWVSSGTPTGRFTDYGASFTFKVNPTAQINAFLYNPADAASAAVLPEWALTGSGCWVVNKKP